MPNIILITLLIFSYLLDCFAFFAKPIEVPASTTKILCPIE